MGLNKASIGNKKYHQGIYKLGNVNKYIGNPSDVVYRSGLEHEFMRFCDVASYVTKWGAEVMVIPYTDHEGNHRRYYPDFYMEIATNDFFARYVIEVKPWQETQAPVVPEHATLTKMRSLEYQLKMYRKNVYKWTKAIEWSKSRDMIFKIITEKNMGDLKRG